MKRRKVVYCCALGWWLSLAGMANPLPGAEKEVAVATIRNAVVKALPMIEKGAAGHLERRTCFSCHNQGVPVFAVQVARQRGFETDAAGFDKQLARTHDVLARWAKSNPERKTFTGGQADTAGYTLLTLELGGWQPDDITAAVVDYLLQRDRDLGYWRSSHLDRPPSEASPFTTTALAVRGLRAFGTPAQQDAIARRLEAARDWLRRAEPRDTEDRVFRLWGLKYAQAEPEEIAAAARDLLQTQRDDGGWGQLAEMDSDAYATGSALTALHLAGGLAVSEPAYQRGIRLLLGKQQADGTWFVRSRSRNRFQTYFETGFPYQKDQWISIAASSWATTALALACPPSPKP
ncbi:MAG: prenyltransferase/squalene oxidase repeat-containing protein [Gemmataceae bacterium]